MGYTGSRVAGSIARGAFGIGDALMQIGQRQRQDEQSEAERRRADRDAQFNAQAMGYAIMNPDSPDWSYGGYDASKDTAVQRAKAVEDARIAAAQNLVQRRVQNLYGEKNDQGSFENPAELEAHASTDADYIAMDFVNRFGQDKAGAMAAIQSVPHEIGRKAQARLKGFYAEKDLAAATEKPDDVNWQYDAERGVQINPRTGAVRTLAGVQPKPTAPAGGAPDLTQDQGKSVSFYQRGRPAFDLIEGFARQFGGATDQMTEEQARGSVAGPDKGRRMLGGLWGVGNALKGPDLQRYDQAVNDFAMAVLRKDSGATITSDEMQFVRDTYIPQATDDPQTARQKLDAAARAIESFRATAGPGASMLDAPPAAGGPAGRRYSPDNPFAPTGG